MNKKINKEDIKILSTPFTDGYVSLSKLMYALYLQKSITLETFNYAISELNKMNDSFDVVTERIRYE